MPPPAELATLTALDAPNHDLARLPRRMRRHAALVAAVLAGRVTERQACAALECSVGAWRECLAGLIDEGERAARREDG